MDNKLTDTDVRALALAICHSRQDGDEEAFQLGQKALLFGLNTGAITTEQLQMANDYVFKIRQRQQKVLEN